MAIPKKSILYAVAAVTTILLIVWTCGAATKRADLPFNAAQWGRQHPPYDLNTSLRYRMLAAAEDSVLKCRSSDEVYILLGIPDGEIDYSSTSDVASGHLYYLGRQGHPSLYFWLPDKTLYLEVKMNRQGKVAGVETHADDGDSLGPAITKKSP